MPTRDDKENVRTPPLKPGVSFLRKGNQLARTETQQATLIIIVTEPRPAESAEAEANKRAERIKPKPAQARRENTIKEARHLFSSPKPPPPRLRPSFLSQLHTQHASSPARRSLSPRLPRARPPPPPILHRPPGETPDRTPPSPRHCGRGPGSRRGPVLVHPSGSGSSSSTGWNGGRALALTGARGGEQAAVALRGSGY